MTSPPALPVLAGLTWSRHKKPGFSTRVASHVSGREVRVALMSYPLYDFEATYSGLASSSATAAFAGLGASSLQALMGFFLQLSGQAGTFLYTDPDDNAVTGQTIGVGDGVTQSFVIGRSLGGFSEPVSWVTNVTNVYLNGVAQASTAWVFTAPNSIGFYLAPAAGVTITADFTFAFECRFLDDQMDFEEFMSGLWKLDSMKFRSIKANVTPAGSPIYKVMFVTSGTSITVPSDWNGSNNVIQVLGAGGGGAGGTGEYVGGGGGGGAYAQISNVALTPGATLYVNIGAGGAGATGTPNQNGAAGGDTWINIAGANSAPSSPSQGALAKGGAGGNLTSAAQGGQASASVGTITYSGGNGGTPNSAAYVGSGGGGAAGPNGAGQNGGAVTSTASTAGGSGGGGADGGSAGASGTASVGGAGGNNHAGSGGAAQQSTSGSGHAGGNSPGNGGGGGGGAFGIYGTTTSAAGGAAGAGLNFTQTSPTATAGPGGGGGGGGPSSAPGYSVGGAGGLYGGGGGAGGWGNPSGTGGAGAQGLIVIGYAGSS